MLGILVAGGVSYLRIQQLRRRSHAAEVIALQVQTRDVLEHLITTTATERALLLAMHNGGGPILAGGHTFASAIHEAKEAHIASVMAEFQGFEVDPHYLTVIHQLEERRTILLRTHDMPESMLRRRYEADGITAALLFKIEDTPYRYYYASFSTTRSEVDFTSPANYARIEAAINRLRTLYRNAKRGGYLA